MQNGSVNGAGAQPVQINPQQAAVFALQFLEGVPHTRQQREAYDIAVSLLNAIATGQVALAAPTPPAPSPPMPDYPQPVPAPQPPSTPAPVPAPPAPSPTPAPPPRAPTAPRQ